MMVDEMDDLRANLRASADGFRPELDAAALAEAGRRRQRRNRVIGGVAGVAALALVVGVGASAILNLPTEHRAVPADAPASPIGTPTTNPVLGEQGSTIPGDKGTLPAGVALPHEGKPVASDEGEWASMPWALMCADASPITVNLPVATRIRLQELPEGTSTEGVLAFATEADAAAFMGRLRDGYAACAGTGAPTSDGYRDRMASGTVTPAVGTEAVNVRIWSESSDGGSAWREVPGGSYDLVARDGAFVALVRASGEYIGDLAGSDEARRLRDIATQILASTASGPDAPSQTTFPRMKPERTLAGDAWKLLEVKDANLGVRVPPGWTVTDEGIAGIAGTATGVRAPSGFTVVISTIDGMATCTARQTGWESLGKVEGLNTSTRDGITGTAEIVWENGERVAWVGLVLDRGPGRCFEQYLDFGNVVPVSVSARANDVDPTPEELGQAVAMLGSARRLA